MQEPQGKHNEKGGYFRTEKVSLESFCFLGHEDGKNSLRYPCLAIATCPPLVRCSEDISQVWGPGPEWDSFHSVTWEEGFRERNYEEQSWVLRETETRHLVGAFGQHLHQPSMHKTISVAMPNKCKETDYALHEKKTKVHFKGKHLGSFSFHQLALSPLPSLPLPSLSQLNMSRVIHQSNEQKTSTSWEVAWGRPRRRGQGVLSTFLGWTVHRAHPPGKFCFSYHSSLPKYK